MTAKANTTENQVNTLSENTNVQVVNNTLENIQDTESTESTERTSRNKTIRQINK